MEWNKVWIFYEGMERNEMNNKLVPSHNPKLRGKKIRGIGWELNGMVRFHSILS